ncbi:MAG: hypothetical protein U1F47_03185 [Hyphomicrobiales bacterium]
MKTRAAFVTSPVPQRLDQEVRGLEPVGIEAALFGLESLPAGQGRSAKSVIEARIAEH